MIFKVVFIFALVAIQLCMGQNNTGTEGQTDDSGATDYDNTEKTALQKGMDPIFDLYQNFLDTVMPKSFYSENTPFNVQDLINITKNNDYSELQSQWQDLVKTFGGYAGCIIVGLIFVVLMPIVGVIYCCCHCCCHKCGGTREMMDPKYASCKRWTYTIILLICATLMLAGGIITFLGSEMLQKSLKNEDGNGLVGKMNESLGHIQTFTNNTLNNMRVIAEKKIIEDGLEKILPEIKDAANRTVGRVKDTINATELLNEASDLGEAATSALDDLKNLKVQLTALTNLQNTISTKLGAVKTEVAGACNGLAECDSIQSLNFNPNFTGLNTLEDKATEVEKAANISNFVADASREFDKVFNEVNGKVQDDIDEADSKIKDLTSKIKKEINDTLTGVADPFVSSIKDGQDFLRDEQDTFSDIADYIWYTCIGLGCAVILVVFFYYLGVLFGLCGERPGPRAACCNRETGAHLLCTGICFSFLFAWLLMLVVILLFTLGGLGYSMACKYISGGVENVKVFESVLTDGFDWDISDRFGVRNLTMGGMFEDCKNDTGVYSALHLQYVFDLDKEFNLSDVKAEVRKMEMGNTFNILPIELLTPQLRAELDNLKNAALNEINFTTYSVELNKTLFGGLQLQSVINDLESAANTLTPAEPGKAADLQKAADELKNLSSNEITQVDSEKGKLSTALSNLEDKAQKSLPNKIDLLVDSINRSETTFNRESGNITAEELKRAVNDILTLIEDTVAATKDFIKNDVGKCRPLYDAAQSVVDAACVVTLDPLNAIWFGLGWSLFFYIPCFIFAALLANLYKRSEKYRKKERGFDDPIHAQYPGDYDGYRGGRHEDHVPLTNMGKEQRYSANGAYNHGYQGREHEHEPRYHRDEHRGYQPDDYSRDRGVPRGDGGHHYAKPHADPYDQPPRYDDAMSDHYDRGYRQGGYPRLSNY